MPTILAVDGNAPEIAARLLEAAGDQPDRVQVATGGKYIGFEVDDDLARAAGYVLDDEDEDDAAGSTPVVSDGPAHIPDPSSDPSTPSEEPADTPTPHEASTPAVEGDTDSIVAADHDTAEATMPEPKTTAKRTTRSK